jgi:hypothetical protein
LQIDGLDLSRDWVFRRMMSRFSVRALCMSIYRDLWPPRALGQSDRLRPDRGRASGVVALEGSVENPKLPEIFVVNDYITSWTASVGAIAALKRRAAEGGSYRVRISLARLSLWLLQMGVFDKSYAYATAGTEGGTNTWRRTSSRLRRLAVTTGGHRSSAYVRYVWVLRHAFSAARSEQSGVARTLTKTRSSARGLDRMTQIGHGRSAEQLRSITGCGKSWRKCTNTSVPWAKPHQPYTTGDENGRQTCWEKSARYGL